MAAAAADDHACLLCACKGESLVVVVRDGVGTTQADTPPSNTTMARELLNFMLLSSVLSLANTILDAKYPMAGCQYGSVW